MKEETFQLIPQRYKESWDYYEQLKTSMLNNLEEMDKLLETYNLPKVNQEETENLNRQLHRGILPKL